MSAPCLRSIITEALCKLRTLQGRLTAASAADSDLPATVMRPTWGMMM